MKQIRPKFRRSVDRGLTRRLSIDPLDNGCIFKMSGLGAGSLVAHDGSGNGNHGRINGNPVCHYFEEIGEWGYDFDGTGDFIDVPNLSDGFIMPAGGGYTEGWTNTGLTYDSTDDCLWVGDFTNSRAVKMTVDGRYLDSFALGFQPQGLAYDSSDDTLWICRSSNFRFEHWNKSGSEISINDRLIVGSGTSPSGCSYSASDDTLWVVYNSTIIWQLDCTAGSNSVVQTPLATVDPTPTGLDGCYFDPSDGTLWVTSDTDDSVYNIDPADGSTIDSWVAGESVEDLVRIGELMFVCLDDLQHSGTAQGNRIFTYALDGTAKSNPFLRKEFSVTGWMRPATTMTNNGVVSCRSGGRDGKFNIALLSSSQPNIRVQASGTHNASVAVSITSTTTWYPFAITYDGATAKVVINGVTTGSTAASGDLKFGQSAFWIGGYVGTSNLFNGDIAGLRVYNRPLSPSEVALAAIPWRRGPERRRVFLPQAGGGGGFQPSWASGSNIVINAGIVNA